MLICSLVALAIGGILTLTGWLMLVVVAFRQGAPWGVGVLLFAPVQWVFVSRYWKRAKNGFVTQTCGWSVLIIAFVLMACAGAMSAISPSDAKKPAADTQAEAASPAAKPAKPAKTAPAASQPPAKPARTAKKSTQRPARQTLSATLAGSQDGSDAEGSSAE